MQTTVLFGDFTNMEKTVNYIFKRVEGGELFDKLVKVGQYDEFTAKLLFYQMVLAIKVIFDQ